MSRDAKRIKSLVAVLELSSRELDRLGATANDAMVGKNRVVQIVRSTIKKAKQWESHER